MAIRKKWLEYSKKLASKSKSYRDFYNTIKTDATRTTHAYNMQRFMDYLVEKKEIQDNEEYDEVAKFDGEKITDLLIGFISELNKDKKANTISTMLAAPELFFTMNRKIWHNKLVRKNIRKNDHIPGGKLPATDEDILDLLEVTKHSRDKAVIHFLASTGSRPAGISDPALRMKHLEYIANPDNSSEREYCYSIKIYDESKEGYWAFLTPEATKALNKYFAWRKNIRKEVFSENTPIFANFSKNAQFEEMSAISLRKIIEKAIKKSAIKRTKTGAKFDKATITMFRKRFNGKLKMENNVNSNIAEKLMAHKRGLDGIYLQPTREECFKEFCKAIPSLTVSPIERQKVEISLRDKKISEYQRERLEKEALEDRLKRQEQAIETMQKQLKTTKR